MLMTRKYIEIYFLMKILILAFPSQNNSSNCIKSSQKLQFISYWNYMESKGTLITSA